MTGLHGVKEKVHAAYVAADGTSIGILIAAFMDMIPSISAVITLLWVGFRLYRDIILWRENRAERKKVIDESINKETD